MFLIQKAVCQPEYLYRITPSIQATRNKFCVLCQEIIKKVRESAKTKQTIGKKYHKRLGILSGITMC